MGPPERLRGVSARVLTAILALLAVGAFVVVAAAATFAENAPSRLVSQFSGAPAAQAPAQAAGTAAAAAPAAAAPAAAPAANAPAVQAPVAQGGIVTRAGGVAELIYVGTIAQGVHVGGIDLSGMDDPTARGVLTNSFGAITQGAVTVTAGASTTAITYGSLNRHVDIDALLGAAFSASPGTALVPTVVFDQAALTNFVNDFATASAQPAVNARAIRTKPSFIAVPGQPAQLFDSASVLPHLLAELGDPNTTTSTAIALTPIDGNPPVIAYAQAASASAAAIAMSVPIVLANSGNTWTIPQNIVHSWINFAEPDGATIQIVFNDLLVEKALASLQKQIDRAPVSASWAFGPNGVTVVPALNGRSLDVARTTRRIELFLQGRGNGTIASDRKFGPTVVSTDPPLTTAEAQKQASKFKLLSTWTTYFQPASHNGFGANIWVPAAYLDNQTVQPGATFSFWDRVGEVSLARGYKLGGAIVNGHTEEGVAIGGGICSTSTTLFNAALRAGLRMGERSNHYYYITRYPVGLDATVSKSSGGGQQDMTFTNDTPYPILIKSFKTGGSVTFSLYGIPTGRTVTFSNPIITNYVRSTSEIVPVSTLPTGRLVRIEYPDDGFDASVTAFVRDAQGKLISNRTYFSHYGMVVGVQYIGDPKGQPLQVPSYAPGVQGG